MATAAESQQTAAGGGLGRVPVRSRCLCRALAAAPRPQSPLPTVFHASNIGLAANLALPLRAGEPIRIYAIGRDPNNPVSYAEATSSVVAEKMFEQIMRLVTFGLALLVGVEQSRGTLIGIVATLAVGFTALWWTLTHQERVLRVGTVWLAKLPRITEPQARQAIGDVLANLSAVTSPRLLTSILGWSVVTWGLFGLFFYLVIAALGDALPRDQWLQVALGAMALSPPTAPTQPGLFHGSVIVPLTALGFGVTGLTAFAIVAHMLEMVLLLVMAGIGMVRMGISAESLLSASQQAPSSD